MILTSGGTIFFYIKLSPYTFKNVFFKKNDLTIKFGDDNNHLKRIKNVVQHLTQIQSHNVF